MKAIANKSCIHRIGHGVNDIITLAQCATGGALADGAEALWIAEAMLAGTDPYLHTAASASSCQQFAITDRRALQAQVTIACRALTTTPCIRAIGFGFVSDETYGAFEASPREPHGPEAVAVAKQMLSSGAIVEHNTDDPRQFQRFALIDRGALRVQLQAKGHNGPSGGPPTTAQPSRRRAS